MKLAAIICEFNPLHTGHKRLIDYARSAADKVVCIMSGNFTQRGLPACADKYARARHAILAGADLVVELPVAFATASAENFAFGGIAAVKRLGADCLVFGSECGEIEPLLNCAAILENAETQLKIREQIARGLNYPAAVAKATGSTELDKPNNTLAVEYLRALQKHSLDDVTPLTIRREDNYNGSAPVEFASSALLRNDISLREKYSFEYVAKDIDDAVSERYLSFAPIALSVATAESLRNTEGVTEGLENRIVAADKTKGYENMMEQIKTKRYTRLKLQRIILNWILGITKEDVCRYKSGFQSVKALAVRQSATALLANTDSKTDELTRRADELYGALAQRKLPSALFVIKE